MFELFELLLNTIINPYINISLYDMILFACLLVYFFLYEIYAYVYHAMIDLGELKST
jgi:hypothetical protein